MTLLLDGFVLLRGAIGPNLQQKLLNDIIEYGSARDTQSSEDFHVGMQYAHFILLTCRKAENIEPVKLNQFMKKSKSRVNILYDDVMQKCTYLKPLIHEWVTKAHKVSDSVPLAHESFPTITRMNYYPKAGKIGWHADTVPGLSREGHLRIESPIVSISLGNSAPFQYRARLEDEPSEVVLQSGDVLVFGGPCRMLYHSVPEIYLETAPTHLNMHQFGNGRFNLTFREKIEVGDDIIGEDEAKYSDRAVMAGLHLYTAKQ